jgi:pyruvate-ferredoxin/flavodoxin oxidoreductase
MKEAVDAGYWHLFRFDPRRKESGLNEFMLDSKKPTASYKDFLESQVRYKSLVRAFPERAKVLFDYAEKFAQEKYEKLVKKANEQ